MVKQERVGRHLRREKRCNNGFKAARTDKVGRRVISRKRIRVHLHRNGKFSFFEKVRKWNLLKTKWAGGTSFKAISATNRIESGKHFEMFEVCINRWPTKDTGRRVSSEQHSPEAAGLTLTRAPSSATRRSPSIWGRTLTRIDSDSKDFRQNVHRAIERCAASSNQSFNLSNFVDWTKMGVEVIRDDQTKIHRNSAKP